MSTSIAQNAGHAAYWDSEATRRPGLYDELQRNPFASSFSYGRRKLHAILERELHSLKKGSRVLDVGCGSGAQLGICQHMGLPVMGLEPSNDLRAAAQRLNPGIPVEDGSVFDLPIGDASFDFAFMIEVLRYFPPANRLTAYREVLRVLRPGGRFFLTMSNRYALDGFAAFFAMKSLAARLRHVPQPPGTYFVSPRQLREELQLAGFGGIEFCGCVFGPIRVAYRLMPRLAPRIAAALDPVDDKLFRSQLMTPLAGHLVAVARRPR